MNEKEHDEHLSPQDAPTSPPENDGRAPAPKKRRANIGPYVAARAKKRFVPANA